MQNYDEVEMPKTTLERVAQKASENVRNSDYMCLSILGKVFNKYVNA